jgi:hypothetical protein
MSSERGTDRSRTDPRAGQAGRQYGEAMNARTRKIAILVTTGITVVAGIITVIYFLQPWRSCSYEDTSAGCAMLPGDAVVMAISMWSTLLGLVILGSVVLIRPREPAR